jgi:hypothetical protein
LFATVAFSLAGSVAHSRAYRSSHRERLGGFTKVCKLPLGLWLPRASGHPPCPERHFVSWRQVSPTFVTFLLQGRPLCALEWGGCSQPSHSPSRDLARFRELLSTFTFRRARRLPKVCKLPLRIWPLSASGHLVRASSLARSARPSCEGGLFVRSGVAAVHSRLILPRGLPSVFESCYRFYTRIVRWLPVVCKLPLSLWLPRASGRLFAPDLPRSRCILLAKAPFVFALVRRLFTAVSFSLTGSRAFSRVVIYCPG